MLYFIFGVALSLLPSVFAQSPSPFEKYTISASGINASFIAYGARLTNLFVADRNGDPQDVALGYTPNHDELSSSGMSACQSLILLTCLVADTMIRLSI